jgi:PAS domain S-box-containing protein
MLLYTAMDGLWVFDAEGRLLEVNDTYCRMSGYTEDELLAMRILDIEALESPPETAAHLQALIAKGESRFETRHRRKDGTQIDVEVRAQYKRPEPRQPAFFVAFIRDITDRKQADAERERLQGQLGQAQRLESVGRLAGGVAHDFNNMVGVIRGYTEMAIARVPDSDPLYADLQEVKTAADRSADLTRQLLAFARQQVAAPRVLDLNDTVEGALKMLRRLIGENIDVAWLPGPGVWPVRVDPAQVDQILANLCVNARDAVAGVGAITIESGNAVLDDSFCAEHPGSVPGEYVRLAVRDTGHGMSPDVMAHVFEPFYTTKAVGEGTGLGLATVYGIVKQNNGFIDVESSPGHGAVFTVYLPRSAGEAVGVIADRPAPVHERGSETVLVVEDEPGMLKMTATALTHLGYRVLAASTPEEALRLAANEEGRIDLLLTDVVMPQMNGRALSERIAGHYPGVRCLFMSGYSANIFGPQGILEDGVHFIQKPFTVGDLATAIRKAIEGRGQREPRPPRT